MRFLQEIQRKAPGEAGAMAIIRTIGLGIIASLLVVLVLGLFTPNQSHASTAYHRHICHYRVVGKRIRGYDYLRVKVDHCPARVVRWRAAGRCISEIGTDLGNWVDKVHQLSSITCLLADWLNAGWEEQRNWTAKHPGKIIYHRIYGIGSP